VSSDTSGLRARAPRGERCARLGSTTLFMLAILPALGLPARGQTQAYVADGDAPGYFEAGARVRYVEKRYSHTERGGELGS
jgi:hypothetical protein